MNTKAIILTLALIPLTAAAIELPELPDKSGNDIKGYVHDGTQGLSGVLVTDGYSITTTASDGSYYLASNTAADFVYYTLPSGYAPVQTDGVVMKFFRPIDRSAGVFRADFELKPIGDDNAFSFLLHADTQPDEYFNTNVYAEMRKAYAAMQATAEKLESAEGFTPLSLHLGDIVYNTPSKTDAGKYIDYKEYRTSVEASGYHTPIFATPGNHDRLYLTDYKEAMERYHNEWGPTYYSFNRGNIHFLSFDNVKVETEREYTRGVSAEALAWIKKDLSYVAKDTKVIVMSHQPLTRNNTAKKAYKDVLDILKDYDVMILTGHLHRIFNNFPEYAPSIKERNHVSLGGYEWRSPIVATDGVPGGYYIYHVDGNDISWKYVWTNKDPDTEMFRLYTNGQFGTTRYGKEDEKTVLMNIWDWDPQWKTSWSLDGVEQGEVSRFAENRRDPWAAYCFDNVPGHDTWSANNTYHVFYCTVPNTGNKVEVTVTDRFGRSSSKSITLPHVDTGGINDVTTAASEVKTAEIYNIQGVRLLTVEGYPEIQSLPLSSGCYVMRLHHTDDTVTVEKVVK